MTKNRYRFILLLTAVLTIICLYIFKFNFDLNVLAFPFSHIADYLRNISLSSSMGNGIGWIIYLSISLLPCVYLIFLIMKHKFKKEDICLIIISIGLFAGLYYLINPYECMLNRVSEEMVNMSKIIISGMIDACIIGYLFLKLLRLIIHADRIKIQKYCSYAFVLIGIICVINVLGIQTHQLFKELENLVTSNTMFDSSKLLPSKFIIIMEYSINVLPQILVIWIISNSIKLLNHLSVDRYSLETMKSIDSLSRIVKYSIAISIIGTMIFNLIQLFLYPLLLNINGKVEIPLSSIGFMLFLLLFIEYVNENKQLKDDNDLFI